MSKDKNITQQELDQIWKKTPQADRKFIATMIVINDALKLKGVRFKPLPADLERLLKRADRATLFSILAECVGLLSRSKVMQRVKADIQDQRDLPRRKPDRT